MKSYKSKQSVSHCFLPECWCNILRNNYFVGKYRNKRLHGQASLPWRLSHGYDPNPPVVLQALLESSGDSRHTSGQHCSLQLRQHGVQGGRLCSQGWGQWLLVLSMLATSATWQVGSIRPEKRYCQLTSMLISDLWCYLPSSLRRKTKAEELNLYAWQIHCNIPGASPLCVFLFVDIWWVFFAWLGLFVGFLVVGNGSRKWKPKFCWPNLYSLSFLSWLLYQDSWKYFLFALVVASGSSAFVIKMPGIASAPHFRTRKQADCGKDSL